MHIAELNHPRLIQLCILLSVAIVSEQATHCTDAFVLNRFFLILFVLQQTTISVNREA